MINLIEKAKALATEKHAHLCLYDIEKTPAIVHIQEVAQWTERAGGTEAMIAAAWLHDIVEDTNISHDDIKEMFGQNISEIVDGLTDPEDFAAMELILRKNKQAERLSQKSHEIKIIKLCDQISNLNRLLTKPPCDWDHTMRVAYIKGAYKVSLHCMGLSSLLDEEMKKIINDVFDTYGVNMTHEHNT